MVKHGFDRKSQQRWRCQHCKITKVEERTFIEISERILAKIESLPQIKSGQWTTQYFIEQVLRNSLKLDSDCDNYDIALVIHGHVIE
jgi:hypothetical protein